MSSPRQYFDEMLARGEAFLDSLPVRRDDLQHHAPGCYSAHSGIKAWQRKAQQTLLSAERWAAVVALRDGIDYPREQLEHAWKQVLFNQFHDVLPGSAIESAYDDARDQLGEAIAISKRIITRAHNVLARQIPIPLVEGTQPVLVFNPHPWPVSTDIELQYGVQPTGVHLVTEDDGAQILSQSTQSVATTADKGRGAVVFRAEVPALGYRTLRMMSGPGRPPAAGPLTVTETLLENDHLRVELDPATGDVISLLDKSTGVDVVGHPESAHTQVCEDPTDTWGHRVISYAWPGAPMELDRIVVREVGPLRARVRVERRWGASLLVEELLLDHDATMLRVDVTLDWREQAHLLKLRFPTALTDPRATYEIPYGELERPVDGAEEPAQTWVDLTGTVGGTPAGLTVIATNKHGWDVSPDASIGITAVRSPVYSWHDPRLLDPDGLYSFQDQGAQRFSYLVAPHAGVHHALEPTRRGLELGLAPRAMLESSHEGEAALTASFADDGGGPVMVTAIKGSEDASGVDGGADLIVRAVETRGVATRSSITLPLVDRTLEAEWGPYQVRTFLVRREGEPVEVDLLELPLS